MGGTSRKKIALAGFAVLCGCAGLGHGGRREPVERLDHRGISARLLNVEAGSVLQFVNADARPHQIYSNDCAELSSTVLRPGDVYAVAVGVGPKVCHFEDLLAPLATEYSGTLEVHDEQEERRLATQD
jgi:hypothetical protein